MYIGIDIGGTKIVIGIIDANYNIIDKKRFSTNPEQGPDSALDKIITRIEKLCRKVEIKPEDLTGIGIGCAGPIDTTKGIIMNPYTLPGWENFSITEKLHNYFNVPVLIENDVNVVLLGEIHISRLYKQHVVLAMFGTGVGISVYQGERLYSTHTNYNPELGHIIISETGPDCYCGNSGCIESLVSGKALNERAAEFGFSDFREVYESYLNGSEIAECYIDQSAKYIAAGLWNVMLVFHPGVIILGGGIMEEYYNLFIDRIMQYLPNKDDFTGNFKIIPSHGHDVPALTGAARLIDIKEGK